MKYNIQDFICAGNAVIKKIIQVGPELGYDILPVNIRMFEFKNEILHLFYGSISVPDGKIQSLQVWRSDVVQSIHVGPVSHVITYFY
jgi:hypothetical protein